MNKEMLRYRLKWLGIKMKTKITHKNIYYNDYAGKELMTLQEANDWIADRIASGAPLMCARYGATELEAVWCYDESAGVGLKERAELLERMKNNAGFFPKDEGYMRKFSDAMKEASKDADLIGVWFNPMEDYVVKKYAPSSRLCHLRGLEPWYVERPWTRALEGKRVVIVHPFDETIRNQYQKRELLFQNEFILPRLKSLYTVRAVQSAGEEQGDGFEDWFEALEWMYGEVMKLDFDVAIIGCGAYGFPLAAKLKNAGKQAVHMGGATQLLFGIKGKRWDSHSIIKKLYNEHWVRPDMNERPKGAENIEQGCYW